VGAGIGLCCSRMLFLRDPDFFDTGVSDRPLLLGVINLYDPFNRSREVSTVGSNGGDDICMARTDSGLRKRGRSLRGVYLASAVSDPGAIGFEDMELSEGMADTTL
jgi:hypothetical protein